MSRPLVWSLRVFAVLVSVLFIFLGTALYERITTNEEMAAKHIQRVFQEERKKRAVDESQFGGQFLKSKDNWHYEFYWKDVRTARLVLGQVQFFPLQSNIWFLDPGEKI